jgi:hypothetical protein
VPISGLSEVPKGAIQSAQFGVSERSKLGTRRKTLTMTAETGLEQKILPPSPYVPPTGGHASIGGKSAPLPPMSASLSEAEAISKNRGAIELTEEDSPELKMLRNLFERALHDERL